MSYELISPLSGFGFGAFGSPAGDALEEGCLCGGSGVCTTASKQAPAMAALRAAMREAGLPAGSGNWSQAEVNALNAFASKNGYPTSSKFLVDGGPCRALKAALSTPPAPVVPSGPPTCASLLSQMPPVPEGTPVASVMAVMQQIAPAGFNVSACFPGQPAQPGPVTPAGPPAEKLPPTGASVTTPSSSSTMLYVGLGVAGLAVVGGLAYAVSRPKKMTSNGRRRRRQAA